MTLSRLPLFVLPLLLLVACQKSEVQYYRIPKEKAASQPQPPLPPSHPPIDGMQMGMNAAASPSEAVAQPATDSLTWTAPGHWQKKPLGQMRRGSYGIKGEGAEEADLSIFVFPGAAGGVLDNVNRWRGQIGLGALDSAKLADECSQMKAAGGLELTVVDMTGSNQDRILGAILVRGPESWFFKMKGPSALVGREKNVFVEFLKTVKAP